MIELKKDMKILFQGDSITDAGRDREDLYNMGNGYAVIVSSYLSATVPEKNLTFINKGVSCECSIDMLKRWKGDTVDIKPDVMIFMAGINDMWRRYDGADTVTTAEQFETNMREMLKQAKEAGVEKIILMEPYLTMNEPDRQIWLKEDLCYKQAAVKKLAEEFGTEFISLQSAFDEACTKREPAFWTLEGVHPKWPGCALIAKNILKVFGYDI